MGRTRDHFKTGGWNSIINFVPHQCAWVVERMGKYHRTLDPGVNVLVPFIDKIKYRQSLKEMTIEIPQQEAITMDNVQLDLDAVLYVRVVDPYKVRMHLIEFDNKNLWRGKNYGSKTNRSKDKEFTSQCKQTLNTI